MKEAFREIKKDFVETFTNSQVRDIYKPAPIPARLKKHKSIAIITDDKAEDLEFFYPYYRFNEAGYEVDVITPSGGAFEGKRGLGLQNSKSIDEVQPGSYELLYLPGGKAPARLRENEKVLKFVRDFAASKKIIAAICHGPQILIAAGLVRGKIISAWPEMKDEIGKAGAIFTDEALQIDGQFVTARCPGDLHRHLYGTLEALAKQERSSKVG